MRELKMEEMLAVSGGKRRVVNECESECECECGGRVKGNNGWGNGPDGTNPGSFSGATAGSKHDNTWSPGDGPRPGKFTTR
jgi:hypothetical protein